MKLKLNATLSTVNETSERTVPPRSVGGARNSFHARSTIVSGAALPPIMLTTINNCDTGLEMASFGYYDGIAVVKERGLKQTTSFSEPNY